LDMRCKSGKGTCHEALLWEVAKDTADAALAEVAQDPKGCWGLLFWTALMTGAEREAIIREWLRLALETVKDAPLLRSLFVIALTFGELGGRFVGWEQVLGSRSMGESQVFNRIRAEGELKKARAWLVSLLKAKYKSAMPADFTQTVEQQSDLALLDRWHNLA